MSLTPPHSNKSIGYQPYVPAPHRIIRRSRNGCLVCRARGKKCDRQQPGSGRECRECSRLNIVCLGYSKKRPAWMKDPDRLKAFKAEIRQWTLDRANTRAQQPLDLRHYMHHMELDTDQGQPSAEDTDDVPVPVETTNLLSPLVDPSWLTPPMPLSRDINHFLSTPSTSRSSTSMSFDLQTFLELSHFHDTYHASRSQAPPEVAAHSFSLPQTYFTPSQHQYQQRTEEVNGISNYGEPTYHSLVYPELSHMTEPPTSYTHYYPC